MKTTWKPQTKKPRASRRNPECPAASRSASPSDCCVPGAAGACAGLRIIPASGTISATSKPSASSADDQPSHSIRPRLPGSMMNWPKEPAALAMPIAMLRFSGGTARPTAPRITENEVPESPSPISRPALSVRVAGESESAINARPTA